MTSNKTVVKSKQTNKQTTTKIKIKIVALFSVEVRRLVPLMSLDTWGSDVINFLMAAWFLC